MARLKKFNSDEIELASSILYYDMDELNRFFSIYDAIRQERFIILDGIFDLFVSYIRKFKKFDDEPQRSRDNMINEIRIRNGQNPNVNIKNNFELWFERVLETDVPMELAEDILHRLIWNEFKNAIISLDKSDISFKEKLSVRPKVPKDLNKSKLSYLVDYEVSEINSNYIYTTGLDDLDLLVKIATGNFIIIAARPGVGKSTFMLQQAIENARKGVKSLFISLEMKEPQVNGRIYNYYIGENIRQQYEDENGKLDCKNLNNTIQSIKNNRAFKNINDNLQLYCPTTTSAQTILNDINDFIDEEGYQAIFIDYLQLLRYVNMDEWGSLRAITKDLKSLANSKNVLVVSASQVSRTSTESGLSLTSLFGSSTIENDTDVVIGIEPVRERRGGEQNLVKVKVLKNREGDLGDIDYYVTYSTSRFNPSN